MNDMRSFAKIKPSRKIPNLQYLALVVLMIKATGTWRRIEKQGKTSQSTIFTERDMRVSTAFRRGGGGEVPNNKRKVLTY